MINSMTGYGEATCELDGISYIVEIKAVNNRYFKSSIKLPDTVAFLEEEIDKLLRNNISRGTVGYTLRLKNVAAKAMFDIDETALRHCVVRLSELSKTLGVEHKIDLATLMNLPGIVEPILPDEQEAKKITDTVLSLSEKAIEQLKIMRQREGAAIAADLVSHCGEIKETVEKIRVQAPKTIEEYYRKLKQRVEELTANMGVKFDDASLARETALFAERSDISEELSRLESHLTQFIETCNSNQQAGRRLDFIGQELLREANTIGSKALNADIARWVVDIKCLVDRIKEQVQNVE